MVYAAYVINDEDGSDSRLYIRSLTDKGTNHEIPLNFISTSTPFVMSDFQSATAPSSKTLYLGSSAGDIHSALLLSSGSLKSDTDIQTDMNGSAVTSLDTSATSPVLHIGASSSNNDSSYYLRAQSEDRFTVFSYKASDSSWT